jgi:hypothetical protein
VYKVIRDQEALKVHKDLILQELLAELVMVVEQEMAELLVYQV